MDRRRFLSRLSNIDTYNNLPLVELAGCSRVLIENHAGVLAYSQEEIAVRMQYGCLRVAGQKMRLAEMHRDQLVISGQIDSISVHRG